MKIEFDFEWTQVRPTAWVAKNIDCWTLRIELREGAYAWRAGPPGGGYDVVTGQSPTLDAVRPEAERALERALTGRPNR